MARSQQEDTGRHSIMPSGDGRDIVPKLTGNVARRSARVTLLVSPDDPSRDSIESIARNIGSSATIFRDRSAALAFLAAEG